MEAHDRERKMRDEENWFLGIYVESAVLTAVDHIFNGSKAQSKYIEEPILKNAGKEEEFTEEELIEQSEQLLASLEIMAMNFELTNRDN